MARVAILTSEGVEPVSLQGRSSLHVGPDNGGVTLAVSGHSAEDSYDLKRDEQGHLMLVPAAPSYACWIVLWWRGPHDSVLRATGFARLLGQSALADDQPESLSAVVVQGPTDLIWTVGRGIHARTYRAVYEKSGWVVAAADDRVWSN